MTALSDVMAATGRDARAAAGVLAQTSAERRTAAITAIASALRRRSGEVLFANDLDVAAAEKSALAPALIQRLRLDADKVEAMALALEAVAAQPDPVGVERARWIRPNGLDIRRVSTPIGVLAIIYESRPNVTADAAALCLRSGNAAILRSGSEALNSARAIHEAVVDGLEAADLPATSVQLVPVTDREAVGHMLAGLDGAIDLIIPRGGKRLVARVRGEARAPVLGHLEGLCHTYLHAAADPQKAQRIVVNAKLRNVSVCGATETLLVDRAAARRLLPDVAADLVAGGCALRGDDEARALVPQMTPATDADWACEYLAPILAVRVVDDLDAAVDHIRRWGSGHTDAIVTEDAAAAERFVAAVDSAIVLVNASTQFADGGEFGFGAEIGIATSKLHARGPVGAEQLTTYKYVVRGEGQVRG